MPGHGIAGAAVVGSQGRVQVATQQAPVGCQIVRAEGDADVGAIEVIRLEVDGPAQWCGDAGAGVRDDLHQAAGAGGGTDKALEQTLLPHDAEEKQGIKIVCLGRGEIRSLKYRP